MQQIAWVDTETGECGERRLTHRAEAEQFYRELKGKQVRVAIEATGHSRWFERLLGELNFELCLHCRQTGSQVGLEAGVGKGLLDGLMELSSLPGHS